MKNRWTFESIVAVLLVGTFGYFLGCEPNPNGTPFSPAQNGGFTNSNSPAAAKPNANGGQFVAAKNTSATSSLLPDRQPGLIRIASFNIQVFGKSKIAKPGMIEHLAQIITQFDIVAIQEIRDAEGKSLPTLVAGINQLSGMRYSYLVSNPLGRTNSKEQYAFVYNTDTIVGSIDACYVVQDPQDRLHREPFVGRFKSIVPAGYEPFSFSLVNIHTDPDEIATELPALGDVLRNIKQFEYTGAFEDDVILLGDLNANPSQFGSLRDVPGIGWVFSDQFTNTARTKLLDNILFDPQLTSEFTRRFGVLDMEAFFRIGRKEATEISDHLPIWAEFLAVEQRPGNGPNMVANGMSNQPQRQSR